MMPIPTCIASPFVRASSLGEIAHSAGGVKGLAASCRGGRDAGAAALRAPPMPADITTPGSWFASARFGLFVHWGPYSLHGREPSWPLVGGLPAFPHCQDIPVADYYRDALHFAPP